MYLLNAHIYTADVKRGNRKSSLYINYIVRNYNSRVI